VLHRLDVQPGVETRLRFLVWLVVGLVVYGFYGRKHSRLAAAD